MARTFKHQTRIIDGYRSKFEKEIAGDLEARGIDYSYEPFRLSYVKPAKNCSYTPDYVLANGIIVEAKGFFEPADRTKHLLIKEQCPHLDIRFVFQNSKTKLRKGSKTTYADWATKNGFKFADKTIPQEWIDEEDKAVLSTSDTKGLRPTGRR